MAAPQNNSPDEFPVVARLEDFDLRSGSRLERILFNQRAWVVAVCVLITVLLATQIFRLQINASFEKMIPTQHPFIVNYLANKDELGASGNNVRIAVVARNGTIFDARYLNTLQKVSDEVFLLPGVNRPYMKSLWTSTTRWLAVTEQGLDGGTVMPSSYDGSLESIQQVRANVERSGEIGQLVSTNLKSSIIYVPLLAYQADGQPLDYKLFSKNLDKIRAKYQKSGVDIRVVGFAQLVGDLINGLQQVALFFLIAVIVCSGMVFWFNRDVRSTALVVVCSLVAVIWQLGVLSILGSGLDPYSMLVPFLVFAIGMSHGTQKMNGILQDIGRGTHKLIAARYTFRRLFFAGLSALLCDAVGFAVLMIIKIEVIQELAISASIGVAILVFTNLVLLPVLLSYAGVSKRAAAHSLEADQTAEKKIPKIWKFFLLFTMRPYAIAAILSSLVIGSLSLVIAKNLKVGDLDPGAPELREDSRYNQDNAFFRANYAASSDVMIVMVKTPEFRCSEYQSEAKLDQLELALQQLPGVESTASLAQLSRNLIVGMNEGNLKWFELIPNQSMLNSILTRAPQGLFNTGCDLLSVHAYLKDHKAETLNSVVDAVEKFSSKNSTPEFHVMLAAGNAGIEAATNIVVEKSSREMLYWIYGAVILLCLATFRSWRAVVAAVLPLALTSVLCEALMVAMGIGVKVATLPVIALGVGIGVDYALYQLTVIQAGLARGLSLYEAQYKALLFTGKVVLLTGLTLGAAVITWAFSPIKFQADMGLLLAFMFVWNMLGSLILLPAICYFLMKPTVAPQMTKRASTNLNLNRGR